MSAETDDLTCTVELFRISYCPVQEFEALSPQIFINGDLVTPSHNEVALIPDKSSKGQVHFPAIPPSPPMPQIIFPSTSSSLPPFEASPGIPATTRTFANCILRTPIQWSWKAEMPVPPTPEPITIPKFMGFGAPSQTPLVVPPPEPKFMVGFNLKVLLALQAKIGDPFRQLDDVYSLNVSEFSKTSPYLRMFFQGICLEFGFTQMPKNLVPSIEFQNESKQLFEYTEQYIQKYIFRNPVEPKPCATSTYFSPTKSGGQVTLYACYNETTGNSCSDTYADWIERHGFYSSHTPSFRQWKELLIPRHINFGEELKPLTMHCICRLEKQYLCDCHRPSSSTA